MPLSGILKLGGGFADDLAGALDLDEAHWVATSAPVRMIRGDTTFLSLVDMDQDGTLEVVAGNALYRPDGAC